LVNDISRSDVDVVMVTGDLIDGLVRDSLRSKNVKSAFTNVHRFLVRDLCRAATIDPRESLIVLPGNHDYSIKGLFPNWFQGEVFRETFKEQFVHKLFPLLRLCMFVFDSNADRSRANLAAGLVSPRDLVAFDELIRWIPGSFPELWRTGTRISLLHHHPMPIAATEERDKITDREEFLLLKNAGLFMAEMVRTEMDLVLHGHKHYPAFSRASFPRPDRTEHMLAVIAAGSVGKSGPIAKSYNLITVEDSGRIIMQRRSCPEVIYEASITVPIRTYEHARRIKWQRLATERAAALRVKKGTRSTFIAKGSGDAHIRETLEGVTSFGGALVPEVTNTIGSRSGLVSELEYVGPTRGRVTWQWTSATDDFSERTGTARFDPPVSDVPFSMVRKTLICNAFYFSRRDRLDATKEETSEEFASVKMAQAFEALTHLLSFPPSCFPQQMKLRVLDTDGRRDQGEEEFARLNFDEFEESRTAVLRIDHPLPGYQYQIFWELPADDPEESPLRATDAGRAAAMISSLLSFRSSPNGKITSILDKLKQEIQQASPFYSSASDNELEITLFCYDEAKKGLCCVAALGDYPPSSKLWEWVVQPGQAIVGQAYRRREAVSYVRVPGVSCSTAPYYRRTPGSPEHTVVFCVPVFYPNTRGRRICVVSVASKSQTSGLLRLDSDEAARWALAEQVTAWCLKSLLAAS